MASSITLQRAATGAIELRRGTFEIILDGESVGSIAQHRTVELQVDPGSHTLQVRSGRYSSPVRRFDATEGENSAFRCNGAVLWPQYVASLVVPAIGLRLHR